jgi:hypothetical protein
VGGDRTSDVLGRLPALYAQHDPTIVLVVPSVNDRKKDVGVSPAMTMSNVKKQVDLARSNGAVPLLQTEPVLNPAVGTAAGDFNWA